jgi:hypothetical protein
LTELKGQIILNITKQKYSKFIVKTSNKFILETKVNVHNKLTKEHTINHRFLQGCPLSSTLFDIYMNEIIAKWNQIYTKGITL